MFEQPRQLNITLKSPAEIEKMRVAGAAAARVLEMIEPYVKPGITTKELDDIMDDYIENVEHAKSADKGYKLGDNYPPYPAATCISVNEVVCHGIPGSYKLKDGDILNIDVTVLKDGYHGDTSRMYIVGHVPPRVEELCKVTQQCMYEAIKTVHPGSNIRDIGDAIEKVAHKAGFTIVEEYCGHGIGSGFHEEPSILHYHNYNNYFNPSISVQEGMCSTIEPMINLGKKKIKQKNGGWTVTTADKKPTAQYEHTLLVTSNGVEVLTLRKDEDFPRIITH